MITIIKNLFFCQTVKLFLLTLLIIFSFLFNLANASTPLSQTPAIQAFINTMVTKHQFNKTELNHLFNQVNIQQEVLYSIANPLEKKPWYIYKKVFFAKDRATEGLEFWNKHEKTLVKAEKQYGVPPSIIISILGIETLYGKFQGKYRVIDSLTTLAFFYPPRSEFFRKELEQYLLLTRENNIPATRFTGSYAGAIGQPQFMPSSYRIYAVAFAGNSTKDLQFNSEDVIGSVANYLKQNGWQANQPVAVPAIVSGNHYKKLTINNMKPIYFLNQLTSYGIKSDTSLNNHGTKVSIIELETEHQPEFWLGLQNFYAITRYNPSVNYAMAVYELSEQIKTLKMQSQKKS